MNAIDPFQILEERIATIDGALSEPSPHFQGVLNAIAGQQPEDSRFGTFDDAINVSSHRWNVDPKLVTAIVRAESAFDPYATSSAGAQGLMQLMPETAASLGVTNPYDPTQNIAAGTRYLRSLLDRFGDNIPSAIAAYNAGPDAVTRYNGIPPYKETQAYVATVLRYYRASP